MRPSAVVQKRHKRLLKDVQKKGLKVAVTCYGNKQVEVFTSLFVEDVKDLEVKFKLDKKLITLPVQNILDVSVLS